MLRRPILIALLVIGGAAPLAAQPRPAVYTGVVLDAEADAPLPGVHVFEAASLHGTVTDTEGRFRLAASPGPLRLYVTMIGYEPVRRALEPAPGAEDTLVVRLHTSVLAVPAITVEADRDRRWPRRFRRFRTMFVGTSPNADSVRIANPEVLDFDGGLGWLSARAAAPLVLENRALGYRVTYFLHAFDARGGTVRYDGEPLYETLAPQDSTEAARWAQARVRAFRGSFRHLLLALLAGRSEDEGFTLYRRHVAGEDRLRPGRFALRPETLLERRADGIYLAFPGAVEVHYHREPADDRFARFMERSGVQPLGRQISFFTLSDGPTRVDDDGEVIDPYGVILSGYFAYEGMAEALPRAYHPPETP